MRAYAAKTKLISQQPSTKKGKRIEAAYQIRPKVRQKRLPCTSSHSNGPRRDQPLDPLRDFGDLEHLRSLMGWVFGPIIVTQQGCPPLQWLNPMLHHGLQNLDAIHASRHLDLEDL
jgi:hypothetical protein